MRNTRFILMEMEKKFQPKYGLVLSVLPYASYYDKSSLLNELVKKAIFFETDDFKIATLINDSLDELDDIYIDKMKKTYGQNKDVKYKEPERIDYRFLEDSYRGACLINSLHSHEYIDMSDKLGQTTIMNIIKSINNIFLGNKKYDETDFQNINNREIASLVKFKTTKLKEKKLSYEKLVIYWEKEKEKEDHDNIRKMITYAVLPYVEKYTNNEILERFKKYSNVFKHEIISTTEKKDQQDIASITKEPYKDVIDTLNKYTTELDLDFSIGTINKIKMIGFESYKFMENVSESIIKVANHSNEKLSKKEFEKMITVFNRIIKENEYDNVKEITFNEIDQLVNNNFKLIHTNKFKK